jgi:hypothetical protein
MLGDGRYVSYLCQMCEVRFRGGNRTDHGEGEEVDEHKLEESHVMGLLEAAKYFFYDSDVIWPLHYSMFYLGHVPKLESLISKEAFTNTMTRARFLHNIHGDFHLAGIRLASRIWGMVQKDMARRREGILLEGMRS